MKICYVIKTCDKYLDTRVKYQLNTFLKYINKEDIYFLTSKPDIEKRHFGWNTDDSYEKLSLKVTSFFYHMDNDKYDWYIFIDDDTFLFPNRFVEMLKNYDSNQKYYIGKELDHLKKHNLVYMSGGAGYVISKPLYLIIHNDIKCFGIEKAAVHWCEDVCIGIWIRHLLNNHKINIINNNNFNISTHINDSELNTAITFHNVREEQQYNFYANILNKEILGEKIDIRSIININSTAFVLITDYKYYNRTKKTIIDLRTKGNWKNEVVLITIDFDLNVNFKDFYNITEVKFPLINKSELIEKIGPNGFSNSDKREIHKLNQWEKFHVFDDYFTKWQRIVFLDAGLRVLDDVKYLLELDYKSKILAPNDAAPYYHPDKIFKYQMSFDNESMVNLVKNDFGEAIFDAQFFLNCMWIYDTSILKICNKQQLIDAMNKYILCKTNEMTIMNLLFHFKYKLWESFPIKSSNNKYLFEWCETNHPFHTTWRDYCFMKYPYSLTLEDT